MFATTLIIEGTVINIEPRNNIKRFIIERSTGHGFNEGVDVGFASLENCANANDINIGDKVVIHAQIAGLMGVGFSLCINDIKSVSDFEK